MGGNLKHSEVPNLPAAMRIPADVYTEIVEQLTDKWIKYGAFGKSWAFTQSVAEKPDHGDIDILVASYLMPSVRAALSQDTWIDPKTKGSYLEQLSHPESQDSFLCTFNTSQGVFDVQVDLIAAPIESFHFAYGYFSYNDLGNLIGRIAHRRGMKFGHDGLWYVHRRGDRQLAEILITQTFPDALDILGFDSRRWELGFETFDEMFQYVADSKYFEKSAYPLEHLNHRARTRDKKRKTYNAFLDWIDCQGEEYVPSDKAPHIEWLRSTFPHVDRAIKEAEAEDDLRQAYSEKVNGKVVAALTGLEGKELGKMMSYVRHVLPRTENTLNYPEAAIHAGITFAYQLFLGEIQVD